MAKRPKHPNKEIEAAILYAEKNGWIYKDSGKNETNKNLSIYNCFETYI